MKHIKSIIAAALTMFVALAVSVTAFAAAAGDGTITITVPTEKQAPTVATKYDIYKVFDATVDPNDSTKVNYTLCNGALTDAMKDAGFSVDDNGNVSGPDSIDAAAIAAIKAYAVDGKTPATTVTAAVGATSVTTEALPYGYYYITTSTGSVVTIDSNNDSAEVEDKNIIPTVVKSAGSQYDAASLAAIAAVGTDQEFTAEITKTKGAINVVFTDTMENLAFNTDSLTITATPTPVKGTDYTVTVTDTGFTVTFTNDYIAKVADDAKITLNYSGKVTSDALSASPATNKASITSGNGNKVDSEIVKVYNAKLTVTKQDGDKNPLAGAGFVIKNAEGKYYKLASDKKSIEWVDSIDDATENVSDAQGAVPAFTGLGIGKYTLVEKTVPAGYNKAADVDFEIKDGDYTATNLEQAKTVINNSGTELPSTGGMGTTLFYVIGGIMVAGAAIALIAKSRVAKIEQ